MKDQAKIEQALKDIHVLFSKCQTYGDDENQIIVNKKQLFRMLEQINQCMYDMMDQYELTTQSRERAERKSVEKGEAIILDATKKAEDVYAAAVLYTDEALKELKLQIGEATMELDTIYAGMRKQLEAQGQRITSNHQELVDQLQEMIEEDKYMKIMEQENKKREALRPKREAMDEEPVFDRTGYRSFLKPDLYRREEPIRIMAPAPEIKINPAYEENTMLDRFEDSGVVSPVSSGPDIKVNYNSEYFRSKNAGLEDFEEGVIEPEEDFEEGIVEPETKKDELDDFEISEFVSLTKPQEEKKGKKSFFGKR